MSKSVIAPLALLVFGYPAALSVAWATGIAESPPLRFGTQRVEPYATDDTTALLLHLDGDVRDAAGRAGKLEHTGGEWIADGVLGGALRCDGGQRMIVPPLDGLADGFTVEAWVYVEALEDGATGIAHHHLASCKGVFEVGFEMRAGSAGTGEPPRPRMRVWTDQGAHELRTYSSFPCRTWVHVAFVYAPNPSLEAQMTLYVHGHPSTPRTAGSQRVSGRLATATSPLVLFRPLQLEAQTWAEEVPIVVSGRQTMIRLPSFGYCTCRTRRSTHAATRSSTSAVQV